MRTCERSPSQKLTRIYACCWKFLALFYEQWRKFDKSFQLAFQRKKVVFVKLKRIRAQLLSATFLFANKNIWEVVSWIFHSLTSIRRTLLGYCQVPALWRFALRNKQNLQQHIFSNKQAMGAVLLVHNPSSPKSQKNPWYEIGLKPPAMNICYCAFSF